MPRKYIFLNLEAETLRAGLSREEMADLAGMTYQTYKNKLSNFTEFTLPETLKIKEILTKRLDQEFTIEYLFNIKD